MSKHLRVLLVEDSEDDALLVLRELRRDNYEMKYERVETAEAMRAALEKQAWDIVLSDYSLPRFNAPAALEVLKETGQDLPFIIISGTIGEDTAVAALKAGAHDFIIKGNTARLIPAIQRELREAESRRARIQAEVALRESEARYRTMFEENWAAKLVVDPETYAILDANPAACKFYSYSREELLSKKLPDFDLPTDEPLADQIEQVLAGQRRFLVLRQWLGSSESCDVEIYPSAINAQGKTLLYCIIHNVTKRVHAVEELRKKKAEFEAIFLSLPDVVIFTDLERRIVMMNPAFKGLFGYDPIEILGKSIRMLYGHWADFDEQGDIRFNPMAEPEMGPYEMDYRKKSGALFTGEAIGTIVKDMDGNNLGYLVIIRDITERKQSELALRRFAERLEILHTIDHAILTEQPLETVAQHVLQYFLQKLSVWAASIAIFNLEKRECTMFVVYNGNQEKPITSMYCSLDRFPQGHIEVLQQSRIQVIEDVQASTELPPGVEALREKGLRSYTALPLVAQGELVGCFNLGADRSGAFAHEHLTIAREVADQLAISIQQIRLRQKVQAYTQELEARVAERTLQLQRAKDGVETILNNSSDAILLLHNNGTIQQTNPAFNEIFGYGEDELFEKLLTTLAQTDDKKRLVETLQRVVDGQQPQRLELVMKRKDGSTLDVDLVLAPIRGALIENLVCSIRDITERKSVERELRRALEKEKELNELKSRFVSMVSHDFRTPLAVIRSSTDILQRYGSRLDEDRKTKHFDKILIQIDRMVELLNDVLTIGRADAGAIPFNPERLDLDQFCRDIAGEFQSAPDMKHTLIYSLSGEPLRVLIDEKLLQQALINLLTNAFKYSPEGETVYLDLLFDKDYATIHVKDSGIGIPEADQPRLFETFHRARNVGMIEGTGLGLAIVKRSIEVHGGTVTFKSKIGVGTTFTIRLPLS